MPLPNYHSVPQPSPPRRLARSSWISVGARQQQQQAWQAGAAGRRLWRRHGLTRLLPPLHHPAIHPQSTLPTIARAPCRLRLKASFPTSAAGTTWQARPSRCSKVSAAKGEGCERAGAAQRSGVCVRAANVMCTGGPQRRGASDERPTAVRPPPRALLRLCCVRRAPRPAPCRQLYSGVRPGRDSGDHRPPADACGRPGRRGLMRARQAGRLASHSCLPGRCMHAARRTECTVPPMHSGLIR